MRKNNGEVENRGLKGSAVFFEPKALYCVAFCEVALYYWRGNKATRRTPNENSLPAL